MTAVTTPRLHLMSPVDSDLFLSSDFSTTFALLDATPGLTIVPNLASLPATWGLAQHGSKVIQADNQAEWMWYNPSGVGSWKRTNTIGLITTAVQSGPVSTTLITPGPVFISSGNFTAPGGRALRVLLSMGLDNTTGSADGIVIITVYDNGTQLEEINYRPGPYVNSIGVRCQETIIIPATSFTAGSSHNITASVRAAAIGTGVGGRGTSSVRVSTLSVSEI